MKNAETPALRNTASRRKEPSLLSVFCSSAVSYMYMVPGTKEVQGKRLGQQATGEAEKWESEQAESGRQPHDIPWRSCNDRTGHTDSHTAWPRSAQKLTSALIKTPRTTETRCKWSWRFKSYFQWSTGKAEPRGSYITDIFQNKARVSWRTSAKRLPWCKRWKLFRQSLTWLNGGLNSRGKHLLQGLACNRCLIKLCGTNRWNTKLHAHKHLT